MAGAGTIASLGFGKTKLSLHSNPGHPSLFTGFRIESKTGLALSRKSNGLREAAQNFASSEHRATIGRKSRRPVFPRQCPHFAGKPCCTRAGSVGYRRWTGGACCLAATRLGRIVASRVPRILPVGNKRRLRERRRCLPATRHCIARSVRAEWHCPPRAHPLEKAHQPLTRNRNRRSGATRYSCCEDSSSRRCSCCTWGIGTSAGWRSSSH